MTKKIVIKFKDGKMLMDMDGFKGKKCLSSAKEIYGMLQANGVDTVMDSMTPKSSMQETEEEDATYVKQSAD